MLLTGGHASNFQLYSSVGVGLVFTNYQFFEQIYPLCFKKNLYVHTTFVLQNIR